MSAKFRASFTEKGDAIKGTIQAQGDTTFLQSCLAEIIIRMAEIYQTTPKHVLVDVWHVIEEEEQGNGSNQLH